MPQVRFLPSWYFNSQPHKEADAGMQVVKASRLYFNSQPHKEADFFRFQFLSQHSISTHSLTRRLTAIIVQHPAFPKNFNSQPHKEADVFQFPYQHQFQHFNSQPHKEADGNDNRRSNGNCNFNSQPHKEADALEGLEGFDEIISTHSLTRRLTAILFNKNRFVQFIFIALYQSPPTTSPPSSFFSPYFLIFSKNIRCESPEDW